jgi:hypothetical protein
MEAVQLTMAMVMGLHVNRLKEELRKRGRSFAGKKGELQDRLKEAVVNNVPVALGNELRRHESMGGLDVTARWVLLTPVAEPVPEPVNEDLRHRPPTEMDGLRNPKYAMVERFQRGVFTGTNEKMRYVKPLRASPLTRNRRKDRTRKKSPSRQLREAMPIEPRILGGPNTDFLKRYSLDENSHPMDWFTALMPMTPDMNREDAAAANVKGDRTTKFAVSNWAAYSNAKAMLCNAGALGHIFSGKFKPFSNQDIMSMIGVYIIDGLAPSPQLTQKMQSQIQQPTHGNDRIAAVMRTGWQQKHRSFRHFFASQDPMMLPPPKSQCPNFKVDELFRWLRHIWKEAWVLGKGFSNDEQPARCRGSRNIRPDVGSSSGWGTGYRRMPLPMMATCGTSISAMSPPTPPSSHRDIVPCIADCCTCFRTCVRAIILALWTIFLILLSSLVPLTR